MRIIVAGDFCDRYRVSDAIQNREYGLLFDEIKPYIQSADYSIVNFEYPIVSEYKKTSPIPKAGPNLKGSVVSIDALKFVGFKCCTLANNHILDQGEECCLDTEIKLNQANIDTIGVGKNLNDAAKILYKQVGLYKLAIINCCENEFNLATDNRAGANPMNPIRQYYQIDEAKRKSDFVLMIIHGGHEHYQLPSIRMQETYRFFVDCGVDAVVNHHQHCYSGYEIYKGKPIFYGIGNFCFDDPLKRNSIWNEGYLVELDFSNQITFNIIPYVQNNDKIGVYSMTPSKRLEFNSMIEKLNSIIVNPNLLYAEQEKYYDIGVEHGLFMFEPWRGSLMYKLFKKRILPSMIKKRISFFLNRIACESHRDKMIHVLTRHNSKLL